MPRLLMVTLLCALLPGCTGALVDALEQRQVRSCIWFSGPFARGVSATGGMPLEVCLAQQHSWP